MLSASDLRKGTIFEYQDEVYKVLDFKHTHLARSSADIRVKIKSLISAKVLSHNFAPDEKFQEPILSRQKRQYLYHDEDSIYLMNKSTYSQEEASKDIAQEQLPFLKEGESVNVLYWEDTLLSIEIPKTVVFKVTEVEPGAKGNSATNIFKNVTIETGYVLKAPLFIKIGDKIKVNTDRGEYLAKA